METKEIIKKEYDIDDTLSSSEKSCAIVRDKRKKIIIAILIVTMLLSIFVAPFIVEKLNIIDRTENILDGKKNTVVAVTATSAVISVAVSAIPGEATTPIANQIAELGNFFIIVLIAIYLLKLLLLVSTSLSFKLLFPAACLLFAASLFSNGNYFRNLAVRILILGLIIFLTVPISVGTMNVVDTALKTEERIETVISEEKIDNNIEQDDQDQESDSGFWVNITDQVKDAADNVANATKGIIQKANDKFNELIDIVASLIITCCVIPLLVIVFLAWVLKMLFGINISTKNIYSQLHNTIGKVSINRKRDIAGEENTEIK